jgi:hypothetical protein
MRFLKRVVLESRSSASASPYAPTAPISGAPRTHIVRMAIAAASALPIFTLITACGSAR